MPGSASLGWRGDCIGPRWRASTLLFRLRAAATSHHGRHTTGEPRHDAIAVDFEDGNGGPAAAAGHHLAQPRQRVDERLQAFARGVRGPDVPEPAPGRRRQQRADGAADRPAGRSRHPCRRHRAQPQPGQPAAELEPARRRDPRQRPVRDPDARRHHRLHPRRLVPGQLDRPAGHQQRLHRPARHHHSAGGAERHHRQRRHGQRGPAGPGAAVDGRPAAARRLHQPGRPRAQGPEHLRRDRRLGHAQRRHAGAERPRLRPAGLRRDLERQRGRGAGADDPDPARLRAQLEGDPDLRPDAAEARPQL